MPAMLLGTSPLQATRSSNLQPGLLTYWWYGYRGQVTVRERSKELMQGHPHRVNKCEDPTI